MRKLILPVCLVLLALLVAAIPKPFKIQEILGTQPVLPTTSYSYTEDIFLGFHFFEDSIGTDAYNPSDNPITNAGATLGRVLFYDTRLSDNLTISCASCHLPQFGFSDSAQLSEGFDGELTHRNSMGLANARMQPMQRFFWDATEDTLRDQVETALTSLVEMGMDMDTMVNRLQSTSFYPGLFTEAYGDANITPERTFAAIGQFVRSMVSFNAPYDIGAFMTFDKHATFPNYTVQENLGKTLFLSPAVGCANCHTSHNFVTLAPFNNGLDQVYADQGLGEATGLAQDMGLFKAPSLRNIELTGPYMHDGRFQTLEEVVEHYNSGVEQHPNLSPLLRENGASNGPPRRLNLTSQEKAALVAFLKTLTDPYFLNDPRWQDPFKVVQADPIPLTPIDSLLAGIPLAVQDAELRTNVKVFPSPATEQFTVAFPNPDGEQVRVVLHEMSGRQVRSIVTEEKSVQIQRGDLAAGTYLVRVNRSQDGFMTKIVLQ